MIILLAGVAAERLVFAAFRCEASGVFKLEHDFSLGIMSLCGVLFAFLRVLLRVRE